ncbi:MAG: hypothetical protein ACO3KD_02010 [Gaiellales bacterium]
MRRLPVLALALVAVAAWPASAFAGAYGVVDDDAFGASGSAAWDDARQLNATVVRIDVHWHEIAPTAPANARRPGSRGYRWAAVDAKVRAAADPAHPATVLMAVGGTPDWARQDRGRGGEPGNPAFLPRRASWRNFIAALATRYSGSYSAGGSVLPRVTAFEIWPNPNLQSGLRPQRMAGRLAAAGLHKSLMAGAGIEIRRVAAARGYTVTLISGGVARTSPGSTIDTQPAAYLRALARSRVSLDAVGLRLAPPSGIEGPGDAGDLSVSDIDAVIAAIDAGWPDQGRSAWLTDYGAPSGPAEAGISDATQQAAVAAFIAATRNARVAVGIWNALQDTDVAPFAGLRSRAPAADQVGPPKPSWTTWTTLLAPPL